MPQTSPVAGSKLRLIGLVVGIVVLFGLGIWLRRTGVLTEQAISSWVGGFGVWSVPMFLVAFTAGVLLNLPGMIFVVVARAAFGPVLGFAVGYAGAVIGVSAPFLLSRRLGAQRPEWKPRWRFVQRLLDGVESKPVRSIVLLRLVLWLSPPLCYGLAFTGIRTRDYVLGSAVGLVPIIAMMSYGASWLW